MPFIDYRTLRAYITFMNMISSKISKGERICDLFDPESVRHSTQLQISCVTC